MKTTHEKRQLLAKLLSGDPAVKSQLKPSKRLTVDLDQLTDEQLDDIIAQGESKPGPEWIITAGGAKKRLDYLTDEELDQIMAAHE